MKKTTAAENPDAYVAGLDGWQRTCVETLRAAVREAGPDLEEAIKWRHLVYFSNGPVLLIRAEEQRVLFGFWRGQRLRGLEKGLKPGGKYEMATQTFRQGEVPNPDLAKQLVREAIALNRHLGDPTLDSPKR